MRFAFCLFGTLSVLVTKSVNVFVLYQLLGKVSIQSFFSSPIGFSCKNPLTDREKVIVLFLFVCDFYFFLTIQSRATHVRILHVWFFSPSILFYIYL